MITRRGTGIVVVAIAVFFLASTTRVGWVHLADAVLWGLLLFSFAVPWISMPGLRVERVLTRNGSGAELWPIEGDGVPLTLTLRNRWWLPRLLVSVSFPVSYGDMSSDVRNVFFWTWPRKHGLAEQQFELQSRGQHTFGDVVIEITGPFGMFRRRRTIAMNHGILSYPAWMHIEKLGIMEALTGDEEGQRKSRTGIDPAGTRAYVPGDPFRLIHWRNSARSGQLAVREFDTWNDRAVVFALDTVNVTGQSPECSLDYATRIAASCSKVIEREGGSVTILTAGGESPDFLAWHGAMEHLARIRQDAPGSQSLAHHISSLQPGKRLMAFISGESTDVAEAISSAALRGIASVAVVFASEEDRDSNALARLQQSGVPAILCTPGEPGELERVLRVIETGGTETRSESRRSSEPEYSAPEAAA